MILYVIVIYVYIDLLAWNGDSSEVLLARIDERWLSKSKDVSYEEIPSCKYDCIIIYGI